MTQIKAFETGEAAATWIRENCRRCVNAEGGIGWDGCEWGINVTISTNEDGRISEETAEAIGYDPFAAWGCKMRVEEEG